MDLSIIIVSYNTKPFTKKCLQSLIHNFCVYKKEIIVVDNGSVDGSVEMIVSEFPTVKLIKNESNKGFSKACNQGIKISNGAYILLLNSDTEVLPNTLNNLIQFAESHPDAGVIGCRHINGKNQPTHSFAYGFIAPCPATSKKAKRLHGWVSGACMLIRRTACLETDVLDERFFFGSEDVDLCWRMIQNGWNVYYTPDAVIIHYGSGSSKNGLPPKIYYEAKRGYIYLINKHCRGLKRLIGRLIFYTQVLPDYWKSRKTGNIELLTICKKLLREADLTYKRGI